MEYLKAEHPYANLKSMGTSMNSLSTLYYEEESVNRSQMEVKQL
jgi:hypothetical protein